MAIRNAVNTGIGEVLFAVQVIWIVKFWQAAQNLRQGFRPNLSRSACAGSHASQANFLTTHLYPSFGEDQIFMA